MLTAIGDAENAQTRAFLPGQEGDAARWITARQAERWNVYFLVGEPKRLINKKVKKQDMARSRWLWADVDARPDLDWSRDVAVDDELNAIRARIDACPVPPTVVIASGGGYQTFWRLAEPFELDGDPVRINELETLNKNLANQVGGDHCHNADRIMRLPGTVNFPNARKRAAGREPTLARLETVRNGAAYPLDAFAVIAPAPAAPPASQGVNGVAPSGALPQKLQRILRAAPAEGDRSSAFYKACCTLFEHGLSDADAVAAFEAAPAGVAAKFIERGGLAGEVARIRTKWKPKTKQPKAQAADAGDDAAPTQADALIRMARDAATLFSTPDGRPHIAVEINGHRETWPLRAKAFKNWLVYSYMRQTGRAPNTDSICQAAMALATLAQFEGEQRNAFIRRAEHEGRLYIDMCDDRWRAIEIDADGWRIVDRPPVHFVRRPGMLPLPEPERGGSIDELRPLLNMQSEDDFRLTVAWLLASLRATGPYPLLAVVGEQGTAKTSTAKLLRGLIDPNVASVRRPPKEERDLWISASNASALFYDNLSSIAEWMSDGLCTIATGGSYAARELRTDDDEALFIVSAPVLLTAIGEVIARSDLADRAVMVTLARIPETARMTDEEFKGAVEKARPRILGVLLDGLSRGVAELPGVKLERLPRMADFIMWTRACEVAFWEGGEVQAAFRRNADDAVDSVIEGDAVASALMAWFAARDREAWRGTTGELLQAVNGFAPDDARRERSWPRNSQALRSRLTMAAPSLSKRGVAFARGKTGGERWVEITAG